MKSIVFTICLFIMVSIFWNCGGESTLSKSQIRQNMLDTLEKSVDRVVTVEAYAGAFQSKGTDEEITDFWAAIGFGTGDHSPTFSVVADIGEIKTTHKYRITGIVTKTDTIKIDGLSEGIGKGSFVIEATKIELLGKNSDFVSYSP